MFGFGQSSQNKQDKNKKKQPVRRPDGYEAPETVGDHLRYAGRQIADVPKDIAIDVKDQFLAALYGTSVTEMRKEDPKKYMSHATALNWDKLQEAYKKADQKKIEEYQGQLEESQKLDNERRSMHRTVQSEAERAIEERKKKEQERLKAIEEEEQQKKQEEEEERKRQEENMASSGQGKKKVGLGQARPKAQPDTNFESGAGKTGK